MPAYTPLLLSPSADYRPYSEHALRPRAEVFSGFGVEWSYGVFPAAQVGSVGLVAVRGILYSAGWYALLQQRVAEVLAAPGVRGCLMVWDSPGGSQLGISDAADFLADPPKPVWSHVAGQCDSGALYLAAQTSRIHASRTTQLGSIGVRIALHDTKKQAEAEGTTVRIFDTGPHKSVGLWGTDVTPEQAARIELMVREKYDDFVAAVARGRGLAVDRVRELADGRSWHAAEAVGLGLIDKVSTLDETIAEFSAHLSGSAGPSPRTERSEPPMAKIHSATLKAHLAAAALTVTPAVLGKLDGADLAAAEIEVTDEQLTDVAELLGVEGAVLTAPPAEPEPRKDPAPAAAALNPKATALVAGATLREAESAEDAVKRLRQRDRDIRALCASIGQADLADRFIDADMDLAEVKDELLKRVGKEHAIADPGDRAQASASDPDAQFKKEYREGRRTYEAQGISEDAYVAMRHNDADGIDLFAFHTADQ